MQSAIEPFQPFSASFVRESKFFNLQVAFKTDVFKLEGDTVTLNGEEVTMPMHKSYNDGSQIQLEDIGTFFSFQIYVLGILPAAIFMIKLLTIFNSELIMGIK